MALLPPPPQKYKAVLAAGAVLLILFVLGAIYGSRGVVDLQRLRAEQSRYEQLAFQQQQINEGLREHIERMKSDDRYLARWAREHLGWVKPGEIIYRFDDKSSTTASPAPNAGP
jgi:cell division protein FtsB